MPASGALDGLDRDAAALYAGIRELPQPLRPAVHRILNIMATVRESAADMLGTICDALSNDEMQYVGVMKNFSDDCKFAFIHCELTQQLYNRDVWVSKEQTVGLTPGGHVRFSVDVDHRGYPLAREVQPCDPAEAAVNTPLQTWMAHVTPDLAPSMPAGPTGFERQLQRAVQHGSPHVPSDNRFSPYPFQGHQHAAAPAGVPAHHGFRYTGTVKPHTKECKFAFIACEYASAQWGKDVFVNKEQTVGLMTGDIVSFEITEPVPGKPVANNIKVDHRPPASAMAAAAAGLAHVTPPMPGSFYSPRPPRASSDAAVYDADDPIFSGSMKAFTPACKFAFIECADTHQVYGKDVYVPKELTHPFRPGQAVRFSVRMEGSKPVAKQIWPA
eukprot:TRINITY_DN28973_c0_g1_i1.p1 TRINITY_DN28973_c0_g1~~TRINITY_DN28973_c0_g1_i1.p1  ORF type:complete len:386 (+),score=77.31 TRINITY_DN28973_c0_g1_i1:103-1260(+)